jgi:hypothetical protein
MKDKYMIHVFTPKGLFESLPMPKVNIKDFIILLNCLDYHEYSISKYNLDHDYWEQCDSEFMEE